MSRPIVSRVQSRRSARLLAESLEPRRLLATLNGGVLEIAGTSAAEAFTVTLSGTNLFVQRNAEAPQTFAAASVTRIRATLGGGNDSILINDSVTTPASLLGGAGDDTLRGGSGRDTIDGGDGSDTVTYVGRNLGVAASVTMTLVAAGSTTQVNGRGTGGRGTEGDAYAFVETIAGGSGNDTLTLSGDTEGAAATPATAPVLRGEGGSGTDTFVIHSGNVSADALVIVADGGDENDIFDFGGNRIPALAISLYGGAGNDLFESETDDGDYRLIDGGTGTDTLRFTSHTRTSYTIPTRVENFVKEEAGTFSVTGNSLDNVIEVAGGGSGFVTIRGGGGNDTIRADSSTGASIFGEAGDDTIFTGAADDVIDGGSGDDTVSYADRATSVAATLTMEITAGAANGHGSGGGDDRDTYAFVEAIVGGSGNDKLTLQAARASGAPTPATPALLRGDGGAGDDQVTVNAGTAGGDAVRILADGGVGNDTLRVFTTDGASLTGGDGNDALFGGVGNDSIEGGNGADTIEGGAGNDTVHGDAGDDVIRGDAGDDSVMGDDGRDAVNGGDGNDFVGGGGGNDNLAGGAGDDLLAGDAGNDSVRGDSGNDRVAGNAGSDRLKGNAGTDTLLGQLGRDFLQGNAGADYLLGGGGNDVLSVDRGDDGVDTLSGNGGRDESYANASAILASIEQRHTL